MYLIIFNHDSIDSYIERDTRGFILWFSSYEAAEEYANNRSGNWKILKEQ